MSVKSVWNNMMGRCYNVTRSDYPSYGAKGIYVCDEWHNYKVFEKWYGDNYYQVDCGLHLDKDLIGGDVYSPTNCVLIPSIINLSIPKSKRDTNHVTGVGKSGKKFEVKVRNIFNGSKNQYIGTYDDEETAIRIYKESKSIIFQTLVGGYEDDMPPHIVKLLRAYKI